MNADAAEPEAADNPWLRRLPILIASAHGRAP